MTSPETEALAEISQAEHERQGAWADRFAHEQKDWLRFQELAAQFGVKVPKSNPLQPRLRLVKP